MSHAVIYTWAAASTTSISAAQTTTGAANLLLNGTLSKPIYNGLFIPLLNQQRFITLTSINDLAGVTVTITGTLQGAIVSQAISGPDDDTVTTTQLFDSVTQVSVSGAVTAMSVGTGLGQTNWATYSPLQPYAAATVAVVVTGTIAYTFNVTMDDVQTDLTPTLFTPIAAMTAASTNELAQLTPAPIRFCNVSIGSGSGSLVFYFLQQGVSV